jgi:archaellum biogenesis protein FlaJ (TadC family)
LANQSAEQTLTDVILKATLAQKPETVNQLVRLTRERLPNVSEQQILDAIAQLQREGKLKLTREQQQTPLSLKAYLKTFNSFWYWTTLIVTFATVAAVFTIPENLQPFVIIRYVFGTVFILWLPGYTFIKALFPTQVPVKTSSENLDSIERVALSIGLSLALVPIVGLLLNYTPWGIRLEPVTLSLTALTLTFATAALLRENETRKKRNSQNLTAIHTQNS